MIFLSTVLACLLIGSGLSAVFIGSGMIVLERGWSMVISGSVVATGGVLLLGITMLIHELRRLPERLADVLPEALPHHAHAATDEFADYRPAEDGYAALRPRIEPEPALPEGPAAAEPRFAASEAADPLPERADAPPSFPTSADAPRREVPDATASSALKIQISVQGTPTHDAPPSSGRDFGGLAPIVDTPRRDADAESGRRGRSLWSRLGRSDKAAPDTIADPDAAPEAPPEPLGPTAAERARERLALADTPESGEEEDAAAATDIPPADEAKGTSADERAATSPTSRGGRADDTGAGRAPAAGAPDTAAPPRASDDAPVVVGSYRAAGNLYVMYDDGSIEAETPHGIFRFGSLDKLKAYIASGEDPALAGPRVERPPTGEPTAAG